MLRQPAEAPPPLGPVERHDGVATLRRVLADRNAAPAIVQRPGPDASRAGRIAASSCALAGATEAIAAHCDQLASTAWRPRKPSRPMWRLLRPGDCAIAGRGGCACSAAWTNRAVADRERPGGRRRRLPLARPSQRTRLRDPFDRRSCQPLPSGGGPRAAVSGTGDRPTAPSTCRTSARRVTLRLARARWPPSPPSSSTNSPPKLRRCCRETGPPSVHYLSGGESGPSPAWRPLTLVGGDHPLGVHVPVNRLAERHRHHGFGFTDYLLVLSDRAGTHAEPPPAAAWLSAGFDGADVVVLEDAVASAWKRTGAARQGHRRHPDGLVAAARPCQRLHRPGPGPAHRTGVHRGDALRDSDHRARRPWSRRRPCSGVWRRHLWRRLGAAGRGRIPQGPVPSDRGRCSRSSVCRCALR